MGQDQSQPGQPGAPAAGQAGAGAGRQTSQSVSASSTMGKKVREEPVLLNVYEPRAEKQQFQMPGFGVYHTGVEVFGTEWMFAGGEGQSGSGIHSQQPRVSPPGSPWEYKQTIQLGVTTALRSDIESLISRMGSEFPASSYHIMQRNCNHFSDAFSSRITKDKKGIPSWVNRTANFGNSLFGPAASAGKGPVATLPEEKPSVFASGGGQRLDGSAVAAPKAASSGKKAAAGGTLATSGAGSSAVAAGAGAGGGGGSGRKNPWRDPDFYPGKKKGEAKEESKTAGAGATAAAAS